MINISIQNGSAFVWNASDWLKLREDHRIVGNLRGCLVGLPRQEALQGLPLVLLPEEVTLLIDKDLARLIDDSSLAECPDENTKEKYETYKEENRKEQMDFYEKQRREQVTSMIDRIIEGKRRKLLGLNTKKKKKNNEDNDNNEEKIPEVEIDREEILKNELSKSADNFCPPVLVQTFTRDATNRFLNENWKEAFRIYKTLPEEAFGTLIKDLANRVYTLFPRDELYPE